MTMRFRCYASASNLSSLDQELARRRGIDGFIDDVGAEALEIDVLDPSELRKVVAAGLRQKIRCAQEAGDEAVTLVIGHRSSWDDKALEAIDMGLIDGAAAMPAHPIDRAYPPPSFQHP